MQLSWSLDVVYNLPPQSVQKVTWYITFSPMSTYELLPCFASASTNPALPCKREINTEHTTDGKIATVVLVQFYFLCAFLEIRTDTNQSEHHWGSTLSHVLEADESSRGQLPKLYSLLLTSKRLSGKWSATSLNTIYCQTLTRGNLLKTQ